MNNRWMKMSVLALSMSAITGTIYAEDQVQQPQVEEAQSSVLLMRQVLVLQQQMLAHKRRV